MENRTKFPKIRGERTHWRDENLSQRHRLWGLAVPAVDIDFILLEYDKGVPTAVIEYKSSFAQEQWPSHPSYQALTALGDRADLPVFVVRYTPTFNWWKIIPLNKVAKARLPERVEVNEVLYVSWLYNLRGLHPPTEILKLLDFAI
jgi:hypothetical protein